MTSRLNIQLAAQQSVVKNYTQCKTTQKKYISFSIFNMAKGAEFHFCINGRHTHVGFFAFISEA